MRNSWWGECLGPALINAAIIDQMRGRLIGKNPLDTEVVWLDLYHTYRDRDSGVSQLLPFLAST